MLVQLHVSFELVISCACWIHCFCNTPIFNISLLVLLLDDINFNIINSIGLFDISNLIIRIYW